MILSLLRDTIQSSETTSQVLQLHNILYNSSINSTCLHLSTCILVHFIKAQCRAYPQLCLTASSLHTLYNLVLYLLLYESLQIQYYVDINDKHSHECNMSIMLTNSPMLRILPQKNTISIHANKSTKIYSLVSPFLTLILQFSIYG